MNLKEEREIFDKESKNGKISESVKVKFLGVDGFDVYNPSIPFMHGGKRYIYGRAEKRDEWARSWVRLFEETARDEFTLVKDSMIYQLEDPYIADIQGEIILGGTRVTKERGQVKTYCGCFYRGNDLDNMYYFTTGPDYMKDIRLVDMKNGKIGVFSRHRSDGILKKYGCESMIGFDMIDDINELTAENIEKAPLVPNIFADFEWGGCNQCYMLSSGKIGIIGHKCYNDKESGNSVYLNVAYIFDPERREMIDTKIIATRKSYPSGAAKRPNLEDCAFPGGIVMREDKKADLYSGIGDCEVGRVTVPYPFEGFGDII